MRLETIAPPGSEEAVAEQGAELVRAGKALGLDLEYQGFLMAWIGTGVRVFVARGEDKAIEGMLLLAIGERWVSNDFSSSVLALAGEHQEELLGFAINVAKAIVATKLYYELPGAKENEQGITDHIMRELRLQ